MDAGLARGALSVVVAMHDESVEFIPDLGTSRLDCD